MGFPFVRGAASRGEQGKRSGEHRQYQADRDHPGLLQDHVGERPWQGDDPGDRGYGRVQSRAPAPLFLRQGGNRRGVGGIRGERLQRGIARGPGTIRNRHRPTQILHSEVSRYRAAQSRDFTSLAGPLRPLQDRGVHQEAGSGVLQRGQRHRRRGDRSRDQEGGVSKGEPESDGDRNPRDVWRG